MLTSAATMSFPCNTRTNFIQTFPFIYELVCENTRLLLGKTRERPNMSRAHGDSCIAQPLVTASAFQQTKGPCAVFFRAPVPTMNQSATMEGRPSLPTEVSTQWRLSKAGVAAWMLQITRATVAGYYRERERQPALVSLGLRFWEEETSGETYCCVPHW